VARRAAEEAEAIYAAVVEARTRGEQSVPDDTGFDPTRPTQSDWQRVLEAYARHAATDPEIATQAATNRARAKATSVGDASKT
jgi:hypothetical protein